MIKKIINKIIKTKEVEPVVEQTPDEKIGMTKEFYDIIDNNFVQYVFNNSSELMSYSLGKRSAIDATTEILEDILVDIAIDNSPELDDEDFDYEEDDESSTGIIDWAENAMENTPENLGPTFKSLDDLANRGSLASVFYGQDALMSSAAINGRMPNGHKLDITDQSIYANIIKESQNYLAIKDSTVGGINTDPAFVARKLNEINSLFSVNCHTCGTPHNYDRPPEHSVFCTFCDKPLVLYLQDFKDGLIYKKYNDKKD